MKITLYYWSREHDGDIEERWFLKDSDADALVAEYGGGVEEIAVSVTPGVLCELLNRGLNHGPAERR